MAQPTWAAPAAGAPYEWLPTLDVPEPGRQRRLTVLLRWLLLIPQFIALFFLGVVAFFAVIAGWFAALVTGRLPDGLARYLSGFLAYETRVQAAATLLVDRYPPFALRPAAPYPVEIEVRPGPLNRLAVLFRIILMIPAAIVQSLLTSGWYAVAFVVWLIVLVLGRMPRPLFEATAAMLRYTVRFSAYLYLLASAYPKGLFGDAQDTPERVSATRPLLIGTGGKVLLVLFLVIGLAGGVAGNTSH